MELRPLLIETGELGRCQEIYASAFEYHKSHYPTGKALLSTPPSNGQGEPTVEEVHGGGFDEFNLYVLADLYNMLGEHERAIQTIRSGIRWLQGRSAQRVWDGVADDREYDTPEMVRPAAGTGSAGGEGAGDAVEEMQPGRYPLDVNARHRLAIARLKLGDLEEAKVSSLPSDAIWNGY
jgi:general transcription factor 3C polypeptide 3 (transcription factor C subunit 4)